MYSILISSVLFVLTAYLFKVTDTASLPWSCFWGCLAFGVGMFGVGFVLRKKVQVVMTDMQMLLQDGQKRMQAKINAFQNRPTGDPHRFLEQMQKDQSALLHEALAATDGLERFRNWVPFFGRQINTTRMQFRYQLKQFDKVDELLPKCLIVDPMSASMKLARMYMKKEPLADLEKVFRKATARTRYDQSALLYGLMSWIYVREGKIDEAFKLLDKGCKDNSVVEGPATTLKRNHDLLANNRVKEFSNAGFGDAWYALFLEEPKVRYERRAPNRFGRFG